MHVVLRLFNQNIFFIYFPFLKTQTGGQKEE